VIFEQFLSNLTYLTLRLKKIAVAVSGGSDSVGLLMLLHHFSKQSGKEIIVLSVNHNLRPEAKEEVEYVKILSKKLGHEAFILSWDHQNNFSNLQARAREARYSLMTEKCKELGIDLLCTAHHEDDFLENYLIRKERKSGIFGLSSGYKTFINDVMVIRPLYNIPKIQVSNYLRRLGVRWFEDASNHTTKYKRGSIRQFLASKNELFKENLRQELAEINIKADSLKNYFIKSIAEVVKIYDYGAAEINLDKFEDEKFVSDNEIKLYLISYILTIISGQVTMPRAESVIKIIELLNQGQNFTKTLHGCFIERGGNSIMIYREFGRVKPRDIVFAPSAIWDNRFKLEGWVDIPGAYITYLTENDYKLLKSELIIKKNVGLRVSRKILFTFPVIKVLEKVVSLPHISYYCSHISSERFSFTFNPRFVSRFTHFC
jgi:tRNA(Ile)-lysidine synthase